MTSMTMMILGALILLGALLISHRQGRPPPRPFERSPLLTPPERLLYMRLLHALPDHFVFAQVSPTEALALRSDARKAQADHEQVARHAFDFVICDQESLPIAVIELEEEGPARARSQPVDEAKDRACASAGLRLVRFRAHALPNRDAIRAAVISAPAPGAHAGRLGRVAPRLS